jgi:outer membrane protein G
MSLRLTANYLLSVRTNPLNAENPAFGDRVDLKARFNANLGSVMQLEPNMDVYPGLDLGLKNFGAHLGFRYFFTDGFGIFGEAGVPIAEYDKNSTDFGHNLNNQFTLNIGASFNL